MPPYLPGSLSHVNELKELAKLVAEELQAVSDATQFSEEVILPYLHAPPSKFVAGMIVLADGTNWNPGSGAGCYRRNEANSAWVFLG